MPTITYTFGDIHYSNIHEVAAEIVHAIPNLCKENVVNREEYILSRLKPVYNERNSLIQELNKRDHNSHRSSSHTKTVVKNISPKNKQ